MANSNSPNQLDSGGQCYHRSKSSTSLFYQIGRERGWDITDATTDEDIHEHWDHKI